MTSPFRFFTTVAKQLLVASVLVGIGLIASPAEAAEILAPTDQVIPQGTTAPVPISVIDAGTGIVGVDIALEFNGGSDGDILNFVSLDFAGTALESWNFASNVVGNVIYLSAGTDGQPLAETGEIVLFNVVFAADPATSPKSSPLTLITADLNEVEAATVTDGSVKLGGDTGVIVLSPSPIKPSQTLTITLTDADLVATPFDVTVTNVNTTESYDVTVNPTGTAGEFEGTIDTKYGVAANAGTPELDVAPNDVIRVDYADAFKTDGTVGTISETVGVVAGYDGTVRTYPTRIDPGDPFTVEVTDLDGGPITVWVRTYPSGASVQVTLTEQSPGVFVATLNNGGPSLALNPGDVIVVDYDDVVGSTGAPVDDVGTVVPGNGSFTLPASVKVSEDLSISLTDPDLQSPNITRVRGDISVTVSSKIGDENGATKDTQVVLLSETDESGDPGVFDGDITTVYGTSGDGGTPELEVDPNDVIVVAYVDPQGVGGVSTPITSGPVDVVAGYDGTVRTYPTRIDPGDPFTVEVTDLDGGPITVWVRTYPSGASVQVTLTEQSPGVFVATLNNGGPSLALNPGDVIVVDYDDVVGSTGAPVDDVGTVVPGNGSFTLPASVKVSEDLSISLTDPDLQSPNITRVRGDISVTVSSKIGDENGATKDTQVVLLSETDESGDPGVFDGDITTVYGTSGDGGTPELEVDPNDVIVVAYVDPQGVGGVSTPITSGPVDVDGGVTGVIVASSAVQAGDGLRIQVTDHDLDGTGQLEVTVSHTDPATGGDVVTVTLDEVAGSPGVFRADPPVETESGTPVADNKLQVSIVHAVDNILITYEDAAPADADQPTRELSLTGVFWGDTSMNNKLGGLDASQILQRSVDSESMTFTLYQYLVGNVDGSTDDGYGAALFSYGGITAADASMVLRKAVFLEPVEGEGPNFPVQSGSPIHPYKRVMDERRIALGSPEIEGSVVSLPVVMDETEGLFSGQLKIGFDSAQYRLVGVSGTEYTADHLVASNAIGDELLIGFAGAQASGAGEGAILQVRFEALNGGSAPFSLDKVALNGGRIQANPVAQVVSPVLPQAFALLQNWPNPFNPETTLRYTLPEASQVRLEVYDMIGQKVQTLVSERQEAGAYQVQWSGRDDSGRAAASGLYFYHIEAGSFSQTRKMSLVR